jgi:hypothetical protein
MVGYRLRMHMGSPQPQGCNGNIQVAIVTDDGNVVAGIELGAHRHLVIAFGDNLR